MSSVVSLGKNESLVSEYQLAYSLTTFFIKSSFTVTDKRFITVFPSLILGIIPVGKTDISYPLRNIATVACHTEIVFPKLIFGIILFLVGFSILSQSFIGFLVLAFGIILVVSSFTTVIVVRNNAGARQVYSIAPWEKAKDRNWSII